MLFWLKKFISFWLMPFNFCMALLVVGWFLTRSPRKARLGRALLTTGLAVLLVFSNKMVSTWIGYSLERAYPPIPELQAGQPPPQRLAICRYVAVLGGGHSDSPGFPATSKLSPSALARLVEAVRILRFLPEAQLIVSGPAVGDNPSHAMVLAQAAVDLGISRDRIRLIDTARDTEDESNEVKKIVGAAPVALVTSAWHMPRAAALFHGAGVNALPCPTDFLFRPAGEFRWTELLWDGDSLARSTWMMRERIGYCWIWLRGRT